jgi:hypothetical protein
MSTCLEKYTCPCIQYHVNEHFIQGEKNTYLSSGKAQGLALNWLFDETLQPHQFGR